MKYDSSEAVSSPSLTYCDHIGVIGIYQAWHFTANLLKFGTFVEYFLFSVLMKTDL